MPETPYHYCHLSFDERCRIQQLLNINVPVSGIARELHRSVSSVTREIKRNRRDDCFSNARSIVARPCARFRTCTLRGLCGRCSARRCANCREVRCTSVCAHFAPDVCTTTAFSNHTKDRRHPALLDGASVNDDVKLTPLRRFETDPLSRSAS